MEWKIKASLFAAMVLWLSSALGQVGNNRYIVYFSDKDNTPYTIDAPFEYLSQRAIERRQNQGIEIDLRQNLGESPEEIPKQFPVFYDTQM